MLRLCCERHLWGWDNGCGDASAGRNHALPHLNICDWRATSGVAHRRSVKQHLQSHVRSDLAPPERLSLHARGKAKAVKEYAGAMSSFSYAKRLPWIYRNTEHPHRPSNQGFPDYCAPVFSCEECETARVYAYVLTWKEKGTRMTLKPSSCILYRTSPKSWLSAVGPWYKPSTWHIACAQALSRVAFPPRVWLVVALLQRRRFIAWPSRGKQCSDC